MTDSSVPPSKKRGPRKEVHDSKTRDLAARWSTIGIQFVISTLIGLYGGKWLDERFGTTPWLMYIGLSLGVLAALYDMVRLTQKSVKNYHEEDSDK